MIYREMMQRGFNRQISSRRKLLNQRECNLLDSLLNETEPDDPFSDEPSKKVTLAALRESAYIRGAYRDVTPRTFLRELSRLAELDLIKFDRGEIIKDSTIILKFDAIGKY